MMSSYEIAASEREWLIDYLRGNDQGISARALILCCMAEGWPHLWDYPHDEDDFGRCERTAAKAPAHLRESAQSVLKEYRRILGEVIA